MSTQRVTLAEARSHLAELIEAVQRGDNAGQLCPLRKC